SCALIGRFGCQSPLFTSNVARWNFPGYGIDSVDYFRSRCLSSHRDERPQQAESSEDHV
ncbi:hypothetical protein ILYODFUR_001305, partial [Ilyodon furcidens]